MADSDGAALAPEPGILRTWLRFLVGDAAAIHRLGATPRLWLVGLLLAFGAGLAREYDAEDLTREPWHLLIAPAASLVAATVLWLLVQLCGLGHWQRPTDSQHAPAARWAPSTFLPFLGLFWLTAPLAWLYGIPYERFLSSYDAALANLWTFKLVAAWRVALMIRVLCVLWGVPWWLSSATVLLFADAAMLIAFSWVPVPIFVFMGGIRLDPTDDLIAGNAFAAQVWGTLALVPLILFWLGSVTRRGERWASMPSAQSVRLHALAVLGALACLGWCLCLAFTQPEQRLRWSVEQAMVDGDFATGLALMERHHPHDPPPHWDPPPRTAYAQPRPDPLAVLMHMTTSEIPERLQFLYEHKLYAWDFGHLHDERKPGVVTLLERLRDASRLVDHYRRNLLHEIGSESKGSPEWKARITALLDRYPERKP